MAVNTVVHVQLRERVTDVNTVVHIQLREDVTDVNTVYVYRLQ